MEITIFAMEDIVDIIKDNAEIDIHQEITTGHHRSRDGIVAMMLYMMKVALNVDSPAIMRLDVVRTADHGL